MTLKLRCLQTSQRFDMPVWDHVFESLQLAASVPLQGLDPAEYNRQIIVRQYEKHGYLLETSNLKEVK